jgi:4-amino-4-deoxy-L-arabinose transferase-like glycosyltransferase
LAIAGYILVTRHWKLILDTKPWWGFLIILAIVLPWFLLVYLREPNFFEVLHQETLGRYTDPDGTPHLEPFYYYIPSLGAFAPWVAFLPAVIISLISQGVRRLSQSYIFLLIASATTFILFSSVGSKREYYLLPLYPLLAILVGKVWDEYLSMKAQTPQRWTWKSVDIPITGFAGLLCAVGVGLPIAARIYLPDYLLSGIGFGILFVALGIVMFIRFFKGKTEETFWMYSLATICLYLFALTTIVPEMDRYRSRKDFFHEAREVVADHPVVDYKYEGFDVQFYLQRLVNYCLTPDELQAFLEQHESVFIVTTGKEYDKLQREAPELLERLDVIQQRTWTSATNPGSQKRLVLLKEQSL